MPTKLTTTVSKIASIPNPVNSELIDDFYKYMTNNGVSFFSKSACPFAITKLVALSCMSKQSTKV